MKRASSFAFAHFDDIILAPRKRNKVKEDESSAKSEGKQKNKNTKEAQSISGQENKPELNLPKESSALQNCTSQDLMKQKIPDCSILITKLSAANLGLYFPPSTTEFYDDEDYCSDWEGLESRLLAGSEQIDAFSVFDSKSLTPKQNNILSNMSKNKAMEDLSAKIISSKELSCDKNLNTKSQSPNNANEYRIRKRGRPRKKTCIEKIDKQKAYSSDFNYDSSQEIDSNNTKHSENVNCIIATESCINESFLSNKDLQSNIDDHGKSKVKKQIEEKDKAQSMPNLYDRLKNKGKVSNRQLRDDSHKNSLKNTLPTTNEHYKNKEDVKGELKNKLPGEEATLKSEDKSSIFKHQNKAKHLKKNKMVTNNQNNFKRQNEGFADNNRKKVEKINSRRIKNNKTDIPSSSKEMIKNYTINDKSNIKITEEPISPQIITRKSKKRESEITPSNDDSISKKDEDIFEKMKRKTGRKATTQGKKLTVSCIENENLSPKDASDNLDKQKTEESNFESISGCLDKNSRENGKKEPAKNIVNCNQINCNEESNSEKNEIDSNKLGNFESTNEVSSKVLRSRRSNMKKFSNDNHHNSENESNNSDSNESLDNDDLGLSDNSDNDPDYFENKIKNKKKSFDNFDKKFSRIAKNIQKKHSKKQHTDFESKFADLSRKFKMKIATNSGASSPIVNKKQSHNSNNVSILGSINTSGSLGLSADVNIDNESADFDNHKKNKISCISRKSNDYISKTKITNMTPEDSNNSSINTCVKSVEPKSKPPNHRITKFGESSNDVINIKKSLISQSLYYKKVSNSILPTIPTLRKKVTDLKSGNINSINTLRKNTVYDQIPGGEQNNSKTSNMNSHTLKSPRKIRITKKGVTQACFIIEKCVKRFKFNKEGRKRIVKTFELLKIPHDDIDSNNQLSYLSTNASPPLQSISSHKTKTLEIMPLNEGMHCSNDDSNSNPEIKKKINKTTESGPVINKFWNPQLLLSCKLCEYKCDIKSSMIGHMLREHAKLLKNIDVAIRSKKNETLFSLNGELLVEGHKSVESTCPICDLKIYSIDKFKTHMSSHAILNRSLVQPMSMLCD